MIDPALAQARARLISHVHEAIGQVRYDSSFPGESWLRLDEHLDALIAVVAQPVSAPVELARERLKDEIEWFSDACESGHPSRMQETKARLRIAIDALIAAVRADSSWSPLASAPREGESYEPCGFDVEVGTAKGGYPCPQQKGHSGPHGVPREDQRRAFEAGWHARQDDGQWLFHGDEPFMGICREAFAAFLASEPER